MTATKSLLDTLKGLDLSGTLCAKAGDDWTGRQELQIGEFEDVCFTLNADATIDTFDADETCNYSYDAEIRTISVDLIEARDNESDEVLNLTTAEIREIEKFIEANHNFEIHLK